MRFQHKSVTLFLIIIIILVTIFVTHYSSRVKYMLDILLAIKNNNINKIPQYDPSHVEHLKKVIRNVIRKGNTIMQFNISLEDLLRGIKY